MHMIGKIGRPPCFDALYGKTMGVSKRTVRKAGGAYRLVKLPVAVQRVLLGIGKKAA